VSYSYSRAKLEGVGLFLSIAGSSRTGKTYTALRIAKGIASNTGKIACIDTEGRRMSHYANEFTFDVFNMPSPFNGSRFVEAAKGAQAEGYSVLVIDSFSLEWTGVGGVLAEHAKQWAAAGYNPKMSDIIWNRVKGPGSEHACMMNEFMQLTMPVIFCLRAKDVADHLGGGWKVEQDRRFMFEWTVGLTLHPDTPGMPRYDMVDAKKKPLWKVQDQHRQLFPEGQLIGEEAGAALQAWRNSAEARALGSAAVERPKRTLAEWLSDLEDDLAIASDQETIDARVSRDDVKGALHVGKETVKAKVAAVIEEARKRVGDTVPHFAKGAAEPGVVTREDAA
jgi:hypothetical protein